MFFSCIAALIVACFSGLGQAVAAGAVDHEPFAAAMRAKVAAAQAANYMVCQGEMVCGIAELPHFYALREYRPAWQDAAGVFAPAADLLKRIERAEEDGLDPQAYHLEAIRRLSDLDRIEHQAGRRLDTALAVDLDFLLTDAFLLLASHLQAGRVNPETLHTEWVVQVDPEVDIARLLERAIETGRIGEALDGFSPPHPEYSSLKKALAHYRSVAAAGEWTRLPEKSTWESGQAGEIAELLQERLTRSGDLAPAPPGPGADADLELYEGLRRFQARHGLEVDGRMGAQTLLALNVPLKERIRQIELNLERWRWLPQDLGERHIWVNVPQFALSVIEEGQVVMAMRVVVGRHYRRTPVFSSLMDHLVFNPDWNIPQRIAVQDILPKARQDPGHMRRQKIRVFESWSRGAAELNPDDIDWSQVTAGNFRYRLMKDPGPHNDLGRIKFMFPNKFSVYLHDTPSKRLFERSMRGFSSGCIRIEKPLDLAVYVLADSPEWSREAVAAAIDAGRLRTVRLKQKIPVHLVYMTAGVNAEGRVEFRQDIYQRDAALDRALRQKPPRLP
jgi:murein L,D-transpeptidase YcbB/YkuD